MSKLTELLKEFEPKPTDKQLKFISSIEYELEIKFEGTTFQEAKEFISEWSPCMSRPVYYGNSSYGGGYCNYDEQDIVLASSGFDTIDFY